ncbi:MAG: hypothetical protein QM764_14930 [Chitinophagaceae bacterium]
MNEMEMVEGGNKADKAVGVGCAVAGVVTFVGGWLSGGLGWLIGGAITTGFCSGYGAAAALDSK